MQGKRTIFIQQQADVRDAPVIKGRGTPSSMGSRFNRDTREAHDDGWGTLEQQVQEAVVAPGTTIIEQEARTILSANDSPDIPFDLSINPYRGCEHGCIYCFARPTHSYLDMSPGLDFETRIIAKVNAADVLRAALSHKHYTPTSLNIGSATDAYQPVERKLRITRALLEVLAAFKHPYSIITKSAGIERDMDLIAPMAAQRMAAVYVSITTLDNTLARAMEPRAAAPARRLETIKRLAAAGIPVGVSVSPIIPFLNEPELERVLAAAREAGAITAFSTVIRLPWEVNPLFQQWLEQHAPDRAARVMARIRELRGGRDNDPSFNTRMTGEGIWSMLLRQRFDKTVKRLGYLTERTPLDTSQFVRTVTPSSVMPLRLDVSSQCGLSAAAVQRSLF